MGSGCLESAAFSRAISAAKSVFCAAARLGVRLQLLDIGGGFPGHEAEGAEVSFREISARIAASLEHHFPARTDIRVIAEPGRYFASAAYTLAANIIGGWASGPDNCLQKYFNFRPERPHVLHQ